MNSSFYAGLSFGFALTTLSIASRGNALDATAMGLATVMAVIMSIIKKA